MYMFSATLLNLRNNTKELMNHKKKVSENEIGMKMGL